MPGAGWRGTTAGVARHRTTVASGNGGGKDRKFLNQFLCAALWTGGLTFPLGGADELFEILNALGTMKFVEWHGVILPGFYGLSSNSCVVLLGGTTGAATCRNSDLVIC